MLSIAAGFLKNDQSGVQIVSRFGRDAFCWIGIYWHMMIKKKTQYIHAGQYVAEMEVDLIDSGDEWAPYLSVEDAKRLDEVREALQKGDLETASGYGRIYKLQPIRP